MINSYENEGITNNYSYNIRNCSKLPNCVGSVPVSGFLPRFLVIDFVFLIFDFLGNIKKKENNLQLD